MDHEVGEETWELAPLLRTKLHRPRLNSDLVHRDRLIQAMHSAQDLSLTLVSAPAGYGKSVLVSQWAEQFDCPVAWLSLDVSDGELRIFLRYFLAAVDTASPGACDATRELLAAGSLAPVPVLAGYLLNDLDAMEAPCTIVLDDSRAANSSAALRSSASSHAAISWTSAPMESSRGRIVSASPSSAVQ